MIASDFVIHGLRHVPELLGNKMRNVVQKTGNITNTFVLNFINYHVGIIFRVEAAATVLLLKILNNGVLDRTWVTGADGVNGGDTVGVVLDKSATR